MRKIIGSIIAVLVIVGGFILEYPAKALEVLERIMTLMGLSGLFNEIIDWVERHPHLALDIAPWVMVGAGIASLAALHGGPCLLDQIRQRSLEILFEENDQTGGYIRRERGETRFSVGIRNARRDHKTVLSVSLRAQDSDFTRIALVEPLAQYNTQWSGPDLILLDSIDLEAGATRFVQLFGVGTTDDPRWGREYRFTLDVRGRDVKTETAEFLFDARNRPMLRKI